jgi:hypothetical protein
MRCTRLLGDAFDHFSDIQSSGRSYTTNQARFIVFFLMVAAFHQEIIEETRVCMSISMGSELGVAVLIILK